MSKNPYNVAIVGSGFGSLVHYPGYKIHPQFNPVVLIARNEKKTKAISDKIGIESWSTDYTEVMQDERIDVVSVATPPKDHFEIVKSALNNGKHVICEKPLGMTAEETKKLKNLTDETGLTAMMNFEHRFIPVRAFLIELINSGYLGEIYEFNISLKNATRLNPRLRGFNWWSDKKQGGGILNAIGPVYLDLITQIFDKVEKVKGCTTTHIKKRLNKQTGKMRKVTSDDAFTALINVSNQITGTLHVSSVAPFGKGKRIEFHGSDGYLSILEDGKIMGAKLQSDKQPLELEIPRHHQLNQIQDEHPLVPPFLKILDIFASGISKGSSPSPNFEDAHRIQNLMDKIRS